MGNSRNEVIDVFRGIAILMVLFFHFPHVPYLNSIGWAGVDLFFVLSGFLVSGLLFKDIQKNRLHIKTFLIRRGLKIYPSFYVMILSTIIAELLITKVFHIYNYRLITSKLLGEIFFIQNYTDSIWIHTWSLAVEEHFYLFLSLIIFIWYRYFKLNPRFIISVWAAVNIVSIMCRAIWGIIPQSHARFDELFLGVFLSYLYYFKREKLSAIITLERIKYGIPLSIFILMALTYFIHNFYDGTLIFLRFFGFSIMDICFATLLISFILYPQLYNQIANGFKGKMLKYIAYIGMYSYSIYLWHIFIWSYYMGLERRFLNQQMNSSLRFCIYLLLTLGLGIFFSKIIEYPVLRFRDKHFPSRGINKKSITPELVLLESQS